MRKKQRCPSLITTAEVPLSKVITSTVPVELPGVDVCNWRGCDGNFFFLINIKHKAQLGQMRMRLVLQIFGHKPEYCTK